jgi:1-acyl-sn-glycerol-3-phosphate acyltransferase
MGKIDPHKKIKSSQTIVVGALNVIMFLAGVKKTVIGLENVPKDEAVLYVANHRSYFDIVVGYATIPTLTGFISKKEMEHIPCVSRWMRNLQCLFLDRDNTREGLKTVLQGIEQIKNGYSIFIMPEGTRNQESEMLPFHEGSLKFAEKSGCAILPVSMNNTDEIFENHFPWIHMAHVIIEYGKPIYVKDLSKEDKKFLGAYVQKIISTTLEKNQPNV